MANRGTITQTELTDVTKDSLIDDNIEDALYYKTVEHIKDAIDMIYEDNKKISYLNVAKYLQPRHPGISPRELINVYSEEITAYSERYG